MTFRHVLLPVDFSEACEGAARYAADFAGRAGARITIVHVAPGPEEGGEERLAAFLPSLDHVERRTVTHGEPGTEIPAAARDLGADLIIIPTRGHGLLRRFLLGSVAAKVLHDCDCPVLTLREPPSSARIDHVLCAVDLGPASANVMRAASGAARLSGCGVTAAHVLPPPHLAGAPYYDIDLWTSRAMAQLTEIRNETGAPAALEVAAGELAPTLNALARRTSADLLVIGRHPALGAGGRLRDSAYSIIREAAVPVLSV